MNNDERVSLVWMSVRSDWDAANTVGYAAGFAGSAGSVNGMDLCEFWAGSCRITAYCAGLCARLFSVACGDGERPADTAFLNARCARSEDAAVHDYALMEQIGRRSLRGRRKFRGVQVRSPAGRARGSR